MPITALPTPPSRSDSPQDFSDRADALLGALPGFVTEANALQSDVNAKESSASSHATVATDKAAEAQGYATTATTKASEAAASAIAAAAAANNAEIAFDSFDDKYLGSKSSDPATDNDGNALLTGALYWNTTVGAVRVWDGSSWLSMAADASIVDFQQAGTGASVRTVQDKLREGVSVKDFGAVGDGVTNDTVAIQAAATYAATSHRELFFPDGTYKVTAKITIDGAATAFRAVRWRGTYCSTGTSAGYAPDLGRAGAIIMTSGNAALEVWFRRFFNENLSIRGIAFVDTASVYPGAITAAAAIKLIKGDPTTYPDEKRYITNHIFEDVAVYGYADAVVFRGSYRKDQGGTYTDNYFGPISFIRFYPYQCGDGIVAENSTLNRLRVSESLFFSLTSGAIVKREAADLPVGARTEMIIMCQLDMVHFEDVRGIFRFSGAPPANEFLNYVSMNDVTRELCGLFDATTGNPYGALEYTNLSIDGRHDQWGEVTAPALGVGSSVTSQTVQSINVLAGPGTSKSPDKINVTRESFSLVSGGASLIKGLVLAEGLGNVFDVTSRVVINGGAGGIKTFRSYGITQAGTVGRWHESSGNIAAGVTADVSTASGAQMQEFVVTNSTGSTVTVDIVVERNHTGCQLYLA